MTAVNAKKRTAVVDAVLAIVAPGPTVDNELAVTVLVDVIIIIVANATEGEPAIDFDHLAMTVGESIANGARRLRDPHDEAPHANRERTTQ